MPIATGRRGGIGRPGLVHWTAARRSTSGAAPRRGMCGKAKAGDGDSCSSSSIGQDSDNVAGGSASEGEESRETEMESGSKGPLDTLEALEESLPMRRGLSGFYAGRSRSFQNLTDAEACSSAGEIGKPENAYTRKRRNQLASSIVQEKSHNDETGGSNEDRSPKRHAAAGGSTVTTCTITSGGSAGYDATAIEEARDPTQSSPPGLLREEVVIKLKRNAL
ncbi:unnamed protein product [Musa acuminata subsp. malaccensis]|uniref:(wild Malaysian banana) hypothetical protein n=1 Tax=Musa acuminata subsp. malaccensis TaxID=214687 RepID=A0A804L1Q1_MUSAM|nr:unnamed protein product [Musa acuminata subsp. malaccensis]